MKTAILVLSLASFPAVAADEHAGHAMPAPVPAAAPAGAPRDAERAAAIPDMSGMPMREHMDDDPLNAMLMLDRLELRDTGAGSALSWATNAWAGRDFSRLLIRTEGEQVGGHVVDAEVSAFWWRPLARWWNQVIGARHDFEPRASRSWLAYGVEGTAPQNVHVEATAYLGERGRTALRLETRYELLLTNRLILQPRVELNAYGKGDPSRGIGAGLSDLDVGLRLRYELRREVAPYLGVAWVSRFGNTADMARASGAAAHDWQLLAGLRLWY